MSSKEIQIIVETHNRLRDKLARGNEKRGSPGPQPAASNMKQMIWDNELARVAQAHADQCKFDHDCADCRRVERFGVGQNLYIYKQSIRKAATNWKRAVTDWYDEVEIFSNKKVEPFQFSAAIGHFSQLVWANTDRVGCGATSYREGKWYATLYTCNYGPNGNFIRGQMYKKGRACSECPTGTSCSRDYPGLCGTGLSPAPSFISSVPTTEKTSIRNQFFFTSTKKPSFTSISTSSTTKFSRKTTKKTTTRRTTKTATTKKPLTIKTTKFPITTRRTTNNLIDNNNLFLNQSVGSTIFNCDFDINTDGCELRNSGVEWKRVDDINNAYYTTDLAYQDTTELFFKNMVSPPSNGIACLDFKYKKFSKFGRKSSLSVVAWPFRGKPGKISVFRDSPDKASWVRAQITFRKVDNFFLVMFRAGGPSTRRDVLHLAVDEVRISSGKCKKRR